MRQSRIDQKDQQLASYLHEAYRGTARLCLNRVSGFGPFVRQPKREIINHLKSIFSEDGCRRLAPQNRIPITISEAGLALALRGSNLSAKDLFDLSNDTLPLLKVPQNIEVVCLHGRQRIEAGREYLAPDDQWWAVDIYLQCSCANLIDSGELNYL